MARLTHAPRPRSASGTSAGGGGGGHAVHGGGFLGARNGGIGGQVPFQHSSSTTTESLADLTRLLGRLQQNILYPDAARERRLRTSEYERNKAETNLNYARSLLTRLEQDALGIKIHSRRQELQADLNRKRDVFDSLAERLRELDEMSIDSDAEDGGEDDDDTDETGEDLLSSIVMTPSESTNSIAGSGGGNGGGVRQDDNDDDDGDQHGWGDVGYDDGQAAEQASAGAGPSSTRHEQSQVSSATRQDSQHKSAGAIEPTQPAGQRPATTTDNTATTTTSQQELRARQPANRKATKLEAAAAEEEGKDTAQTTQSSTTARAQLFAGRGTSAATTTDVSTSATTEAILDHQRAEQDALTENLVRMAASLKKSSQAFSTSLEQEKDVLDATGRSLERNELGLEGASRRMGAIRKMSEGQGWLGRMKLYAMIFGMAVAAVLLVFVMPKLRF
ncbi:hypothetical protein Micbo1qcDRAFT_231954 [Microdochium bolleyi]|uniref:Synaptobrevin n=1 Tax=Microdochium bolleyi TaxID=196109 RepID=A0A136JBC7_9PEZI|nr:hypothetical protein Micbo1qcDRAFT_231954 [Microdochium bolleyi]